MHLPWCVRKCPYCDFNSHPLRGEVPEAAYLDALERDLTATLPEVWGRPVESVFLGGGTPSLFTAQAIDRLLTLVRTLLPVPPWAEITLEANPGTFEVARFRAYRAAGVSRLSLGIQSFNPRHLQALGRIHDEKQARVAVEAALDLFQAVNLDLMYALPGQTLAELEADLRIALDYRPAHLSVYHLTLEPNTAFAANPPELPDEDLAADMQETVEAMLDAAGYGHYEVSAWALPGYRCRHNLNYWLFGDYLGIGAGAHAKLTLGQQIVRQTRVRHPPDYLRRAVLGEPLGETRRVDLRELPFEFMMNALRLTEGFPRELFPARTGLPLDVVHRPLAQAQRLGLLAQDLTHIRPTDRGRRYLNDLLQLFLAEWRVGSG